MNEDRMKRLQIRPEVLMFLGSGKFEVVANELPRDAKLERAYYDEPAGVFCLVISSKEFEPVEAGHEIPIMRSVAIQRIGEPNENLA